MLTNCLKVLATQGWEKTTVADFAKPSLEQLLTQFAEPLRRTNFDALVMEDVGLCQAVPKSSVIWWKLFNAACAKKWANSGL